MRRCALALLFVAVAGMVTAPVVNAQTDDQLATARRLQKEANDDFNAGRTREGIPKAREALKLRESVLGPDHLAVAESAHTLGNLIRDTGDYPAARALHERALAIRERLVGPQHPFTASSLSSLGFVIYLMGDPAGARPLIERGLAIRERALGPNHVVTAFSLNDVGVVLTALGDYRGVRAGAGDPRADARLSASPDRRLPRQPRGSPP